MSYVFPFLPLQEFYQLLLEDKILYYFSDLSSFQNYISIVQNMINKYKSNEENMQCLKNYINTLKDQSYSNLTRIIQGCSNHTKFFYHSIYLQSNILYNDLIAQNPLLSNLLSFSFSNIKLPQQQNLQQNLSRNYSSHSSSTKIQHLMQQRIRSSEGKFTKSESKTSFKS